MSGYNFKTGTLYSYVFVADKKTLTKYIYPVYVSSDSITGERYYCKTINEAEEHNRFNKTTDADLNVLIHYASVYQLLTLNPNSTEFMKLLKEKFEADKQEAIKKCDDNLRTLFNCRLTEVTMQDEEE